MVEKSHTAGGLPDFLEPFRQLRQKVTDWFAPLSEASASNEHYEILVELPGVNKDDIDISLHDGNLVVRGEKRSQREHSDRTYFFSEREYGAFQRTFRMPPDADQDDVDAAFSNGILTLRVPKTKAVEPGRKRIEIRQT
ncbi:MAG: Hsp20/alpha crystallin family protein [Hyphomicrobiaceae bacterium]